MIMMIEHVVDRMAWLWFVCGFFVVHLFNAVAFAKTAPKKKCRDASLIAYLLTRSCRNHLIGNFRFSLSFLLLFLARCAASGQNEIYTRKTSSALIWEKKHNKKKSLRNEQCEQTAIIFYASCMVEYMGQLDLVCVRVLLRFSPSDGLTKFSFSMLML